MAKVVRHGVVVFILSTLLGGTAVAQDAFSLAEGKWGAINDGAGGCSDPKVNPHTIRFTSDRQTAIFQTDRPFKSQDGTMKNSYRYRVLASSGNTITMALDGETRKTDSGKLVVWIFILVNRDTYTWSRSDWPRDFVTRGRWARC